MKNIKNHRKDTNIGIIIGLLVLFLFVNLLVLDENNLSIFKIFLVTEIIVIIVIWFIPLDDADFDIGGRGMFWPW